MLSLGMHPAEEPVLEALAKAERGTLSFEDLLTRSGLSERGLRNVLFHLQQKGAVLLLYSAKGLFVRITPRGRRMLAEGVDPVFDVLPF